jgi:DNA-binding MarR family transcriptional regulator
VYNGAGSTVSNGGRLGPAPTRPSATHDTPKVIERYMILPCGAANLNLQSVVSAYEFVTRFENRYLHNQRYCDRRCRGRVPYRMSSVESGGDDGAGRQRRRATLAIKDSLRQLSNQLSLLNHHVGVRIGLKDVDLDCLDLIARHGPLSPSALARRAGLHPATMTGVLDRLQRAGWITRERDPSGADRRAVTIHAVRERGGELFRLYAGMNNALDEICAGYGETELELLADFLRRTTDAGRDATDELADQ